VTADAASPTDEGFVAFYRKVIDHLPLPDDLSDLAYRQANELAFQRYDLQPTALSCRFGQPFTDLRGTSMIAPDRFEPGQRLPPGVVR